MGENMLTSDQALVLTLARDREQTGGVRLRPDSPWEIVSCFANGWLDADANITDEGRQLLVSLEAYERELTAHMNDLAEAEEMDRLDRLCRRRPSRRQR